MLSLAHGAIALQMGGPLHIARGSGPRAAVALAAAPPKLEASPRTTAANDFPLWPESAIAGRRELTHVIETFEELAIGVPLRASSASADGYRAWLDGGFAAHRFINQKLSRQTYVPILQLLLQLMVGAQARYPDLYAVMKFVPKKNGLNPLLAQLQEGTDPQELRIDQLKPRDVRRRLDDLQRALEQSWLLLGSYLTLPSKHERDDFLWSSRTVVEKVKTDQRSRALEMLCLGFFNRDASMYPLVVAHGLDGTRWPLKKGFEANFGVDTWHPKPTNARMIWQRSRMVYPFLECAHRAWLNHTEQPLGLMGPDDCNPAPIDGFVVECGADADEENAAAVGELLDSIARASPEEKVLNSLLYWLIDLCYKVMLNGVEIKPWDPEPYILRRPGVEPRMVDMLARLGHLLQLLYCEEHFNVGPEGALRGDRLLLQVKEVETATTLLANVQASCAESCPTVVEQYEELLLAPELTLGRLEQLEYDALAALLSLEPSFVAERSATVRQALAEWRNPELLFRYLEDNRHDERMLALITRWLRAIFGLSAETLRMIRRESSANVRHLLLIPQDVLLRWYSEACPGTSKCKTLFMLGEDAGSCLRIISNDGSKYNRALMGYVLQSHVRALVITDAVGRVMCRSLIRLVLRSDTLTPVIFCDPMFFTLGYSRDLQRELLAQARQLEAQMQIPVVHAGSVLPLLSGAERVAVEEAEKAEVVDGGMGGMGGCFVGDFERGYVRRVAALDYNFTFVELLEMDGVAPYTYSEELPYDDLLQQHTSGVQTRSKERSVVVIATLPRADSPSAARYVAERVGETAWTMHLSERESVGVEKIALPEQLAQQIGRREHVSAQAANAQPPTSFDPNARAWDEDLPTNYKAPSLDE